MLDGQCCVRCERKVERAQRDSFRKTRDTKTSGVLVLLN